MQGIAVFRRNASFSWLRLARLISFFGDIVTATALVIHLTETTHNSITVSLLLILSAIPRLLGPLAGILANRVDQRGLMIACELGQAAIFGLMLLLRSSLRAILILAFLASTLATIYAPAGRTALPKLVQRGDLPKWQLSKNSPHNTTRMR